MQRQIREEARRFNVVALGRRSGKTLLGEDLVVETVLDDRVPCAWFAPTYKELAAAWRELKELLQPIAVKVSEQEHRIEVLGGGALECWSLDSADTARGRRYGRVIVDEAAMVANLADAWDNVIRPMLTDLRGDAWFLSTPKGLNAFHVLYQRGRDAQQPDWMSWQAPTSCNPYIDPTEIEAAKRDQPERVFAQEYLAEFLVDGVGVFRGVAAACRAKPVDRAQDGRTYTFGVDWGKLSDFTVISVIDSTTREQVWIERFNQIDYYVQKARLAILAQKYKPQLIVAEANAMGAPNVEDLQRMGLPVWAWIPNNASKAAAVEGLALAIERGDLALLSHQVQTGELLAFDAERLPSGMVRYGAVSGHDDTVVALMLAWLAACQAPAKLRHGEFSMGA